MLRARLTEPRAVISVYDPAIMGIDYQKLHKYKMTRNLDDLGDLSVLKEKPTIHMLEPMLPMYEGFRDKPAFNYAVHCSKIIDGPVTDKDFETDDGRTSLKFEAIAKIPDKSVIELGGVVLQLASVDGIISPFILLDSTWDAWVRNLQSLNAMRALTESRADTPPSKPSA